MSNRMTFVFEGYDYEPLSGEAVFRYSFDGQHQFIEKATFVPSSNYSQLVFDRVLRLCFFVIGTSYYKCFPTRKVKFVDQRLTPLDAKILNAIYRDGLSQFVFENSLGPNALARFEPDIEQIEPLGYDPEGVVIMQSGGKDSLLLAQLISELAVEYTPWFMSQSDHHPVVLDALGAKPLRQVRRVVDVDAIRQARNDGGLNGHVPVTYITASLALADAVLHGDNTVLSAIGNEGNEPHEYIGDFAVNHQWSKTWLAEKILSEYVAGQISPYIHIGSPLRSFSELRIAELFVEHAWGKYGDSFSSCNLANYSQGHDNSRLGWCGDCPKCANSYLLFAPFVQPEELLSLFAGRDLFTESNLEQTFKGLLGIDDVMKPFECVGEVDELRRAYEMAVSKYGYKLPLDVPSSSFDYRALGDRQQWTEQYIPRELLGV